MLGGLVPRRRTVSRRGDIAVGQHHSITPAERVRLARPAVAMQRLVQPAPAAVTGEQLPCSIGAVGSRCETDNEQAALRIAEAWSRPAPILFLGELPLLHPSDCTTVRPEP